MPLELRSVVMYGMSNDTTYQPGLPVAVGEVELVPDLPVSPDIDVFESSPLVKYGSDVILDGVLSDTEGVSLEGESIALEHYVSGAWTAIPSAVTTVGPDGIFGFILHTSRKGLYRFAYSGSDLALPSLSDTITVNVQAAIKLPKASLKGHRLTVSGGLTPITSGSVRIYYERKVNGKYKAYTSRSASVKSKGTFSSTLTLPKGTWRVRVKHQTSSWATSYSAWKYLTIR